MASQFLQVSEASFSALENELTTLMCKCKFISEAAYRAADEVDAIKLSDSLSATAALISDLANALGNASSIIQEVSSTQASAQ